MQNPTEAEVPSVDDVDAVHDRIAHRVVGAGGCRRGEDVDGLAGMVALVLHRGLRVALAPAPGRLTRSLERVVG